MDCCLLCYPGCLDRASPEKTVLVAVTLNSYKKKLCAPPKWCVPIYFVSSGKETSYFGTSQSQQQRAEQASSHAPGSPAVPLNCHKAGVFSWLNVEQINKVSIRKATCCQEGEGAPLSIHQQKRTCRKSEAAPCQVTRSDNFFCCCPSS